MKQIDLDLEIDFVSASSYGGGTVSSGEVKIKKDIELEIKGKHVLIIEDIIDTGNTLRALKDYFFLKKPEECQNLHAFWTSRPEDRRRCTAIISDFR